MSTQTMAPPGWYVDPSRPDQPRFWDGYQFRDQGVTICVAGHESPMNAIFCPECGAAVGAVPLAALTGHPQRRRQDDQPPQVPVPGGDRGGAAEPALQGGKARGRVRYQLARAGGGVGHLLTLRLPRPRRNATASSTGLLLPGTRPLRTGLLRAALWGRSDPAPTQKSVPFESSRSGVRLLKSPPVIVSVAGNPGRSGR